MLDSEQEVVQVRFVQEREVRHSIGGVAHQNLVYAWSLPDAMQPADVSDALARVARRHEVLRSSFHIVEDDVVGVVAADAVIPCMWLGDVSEPAFQDMIARFAREPFRLSSAPLARTLLGRVDGGSRVLALVVAHIVWDAASSALFARELVDERLPAPAIQFWDLAAFEREQTSGPKHDFWRRRLDAYRPRLHIATHAPSQHACAPAERRFRAASSAVAKRLQAVARSERSTLSTAALAGFIALLSWTSGERDVTVAVVASNRDRPELQGLLGYLARVDLVRLRLSVDQPFHALLRATHEATREAYEHDLPAEQQVGGGAALARLPVPLSEALFNFVPAPVDGGKPPLVPYTPRIDWTKFPATATPWGAQVDVELFERPDGSIDGVLSYDRNRIEPAGASDLADAFAWLLERLTASPESTLATLMPSARPRVGTPASSHPGSP